MKVGPMMRDAEWYSSNRAAIESRVAFLRDLREGVVYDGPGAGHRIRVLKQGDRLELHFYGGEVTNQASEVISDLEYDRPLHLWAGFTQAMMLGLLWKPRPERVHVLGFGAGRVPMVLHHHFPQVYVESTELDPEVVTVAREYFGIQTDERMRVIVDEGRRYLEHLESDSVFDIIMIDAFSGLGYSPFPLATQEFYEICSSHLSDGGVVVINLMVRDFLIQHKLRTLLECFRDVQGVVVPQDGTIALFASDQPSRSMATVAREAEALQRVHQFESPFVEHAQRMRPVGRIPEIADVLPHARVLRDNVSPPAQKTVTAVHAPPSFSSTPGSKTEVGRNDPCPCGSGKKYKKCHGQPT
jgi:spermidine synthase